MMIFIPYNAQPKVKGSRAMFVAEMGRQQTTHSCPRDGSEDSPTDSLCVQGIPVIS